MGVGIASLDIILLLASMVFYSVPVVISTASCRNSVPHPSFRQVIKQYPWADDNHPVGHSISMFKDAASLIRHGMYLSNGSYQPFAIRVLGERLYIVTGPEDVTTVYKNSASFSWDAYMDRLLNSFGLSKAARKVSWRKPNPDDPNDAHMRVINPQRKCLVHLIEDIYKMQLLPGDRLNTMLDTVMCRLDKWMNWSHLYGPFVTRSTIGERELSVKALCSFLITDSTTRAMFGDLIFQIEPDLIEQMSIFNENSWAVVFNVPSFFMSRLNKARNRLSQAICRYLDTPPSQRTHQAWSVGAIIEAVDIFAMDRDSQVAMLLMIWWAAHSNTINACFWLLSYVVYDPDLMDLLRKETQPAFQGTNMDVQYIANDCPHLESTYYETLRLVNGAMSIRRVDSDTTISGKLLKAGNTVVIPYREIHYNPNVWGNSVSQFFPERFFQQSKLASHPSYRPFGGGVSYCPGRHLAKAEVCGFVAAFINRFEVEVPRRADGSMQPFPTLDTTKPSTGITSCMPDMDLLVKIRTRNVGSGGIHMPHD